MHFQIHTGHEVIFDPDDSPTRPATCSGAHDIDLALSSLADENPVVILRSIQFLLDASSGLPFDVLLSALHQLRDLIELFIRICPGFVECSLELLVILSGFPDFSEPLVAGGLLDFFIDNIPWEPAIEACGCLARDAILECGGLSRVLEASASLAPDFGALCDFARPRVV
jgi:hypothetical protein